MSIKSQSYKITEHRECLVTESARQHHNSLLYFVYGLTHQWQDAENIVQDLWRYVLLKFPEHNINNRSVLFDKARKLFIDYYRSNQRKPTYNASELQEHHMAMQDKEMASIEEEQGLKERFYAEYPNLNLTDDQKHILWLYARYGFTYQELHQRTGYSVSTIGDWIKLGRIRLAACINQENTPHD